MNETVGAIRFQALDYAELTTTLVAAYVSNNHVQPSEIGTLIASTHAALTGLVKDHASKAPAIGKLTPAQIRKSITPDALISLIDGKPYKTLKRHLASNGMTVEQYRERYGLPRDYPSTAASYSAIRAEFARSSRLGHARRKMALEAAAVPGTVSEKPQRAGRPRKVKKAARA